MCTCTQQNFPPFVNQNEGLFLLLHCHIIIIVKHDQKKNKKKEREKGENKKRSRKKGQLTRHHFFVAFCRRGEHTFQTFPLPSCCLSLSSPESQNKQTFILHTSTHLIIHKLSVGLFFSAGEFETAQWK